MYNINSHWSLQNRSVAYTFLILCANVKKTINNNNKEQGINYKTTTTVNYGMDVYGINMEESMSELEPPQILPRYIFNLFETNSRLF